MAVESADDRLAFLSPDEFGDEATYRPAATGEESVPIVGIFDNTHELVAAGNSPGSSDARPTFYCRSQDLPEGAEGGDAGDRLTITHLGVLRNYRVIDLEPDGQGFTRLELGAT
jgi:hypothetical protein